jgi:hypothetical protein
MQTQMQIQTQISEIKNDLPPQFTWQVYKIHNNDNT